MRAQSAVIFVCIMRIVNLLFSDLSRSASDPNTVALLYLGAHKPVLHSCYAANIPHEPKSIRLQASSLSLILLFCRCSTLAKTIFAHYIFASSHSITCSRSTRTALQLLARERHRWTFIPNRTLIRYASSTLLRQTFLCSICAPLLTGENLLDALGSAH